MSAGKYWDCKNCNSSAVTYDEKIPMHPCMGIKMIPLVPKGESSKIEVVEREDYIGKENVELVDGRPVMSVVTTTDERQDTVIFAPCSQVGSKTGRK